MKIRAETPKPVRRRGVARLKKTRSFRNRFSPWEKIIMRAFAGPETKFQRAEMHLSYLIQEESRFWAINTQNIKYVEEFDARYSSRCMKIKLDAAVDEKMHVIAGELIYQLRPLLTKRPSRWRVQRSRFLHRSLSFFLLEKRKPILKTMSEKSDGVDARFVAIVRELTVFRSGNADLYSVFPMANVDKHNQLLASHAQGQIESAYDGTVSNAEVGILVGGLASPKDGVVISILGEHGRSPPPLHGNRWRDYAKLGGRLRWGAAHSPPGKYDRRHTESRKAQLSFEGESYLPNRDCATSPIFKLQVCCRLTLPEISHIQHVRSMATRLEGWPKSGQVPTA